MARSNRRWRWLHFGLLSLLAASVSCALWSGERFSAQSLMHGLDNLLFDVGFRARGPVSPSQIEKSPHTRDIVMVETTHQLPRPIVARLIHQLRLARVVALDFMLVDDERNYTPDEKQLLASQIARDRKDTAILAQAVRAHGRVILASWPEEERVQNADNLLNPTLKTVSSSVKTVWRRPPKALWNATRWHAHVMVEADDDVVRRVRLLQPDRDNIPNTTLPCLGLAIAALSQKQPVQNWFQQRDAKLRFALDNSGAMPINWLGGREVFGQLSNSIGYLQVFDWEAEDFRDKIVIVGEVSRQAKEIVLTPWGEAPAMQAHANIAATLLDPRGTLRLPHWGWVFLASWSLCWCLSLPLLRWPLWTSFALAAILALGVAALVIWGMSARQTMWPGSVPLVAMLGCLNGLALYEYRRTRHTLGRFIGHEMIGRALHPLTDLQPGGQEEVATAMFCDLRGYSTLAEKMTPTQVTKMVNDYSALLLRVVPGHGGRAVDYQGDGVFVLFETALTGKKHALKAVRAALEIQEEFRTFNRLWRERTGSALEVGIGIESGPMVIGILGSRDRIHLGAVGDAVNVAARVQGMTRELDASIIITQRVCEQLGNDGREFHIMPRGRHAVKGRTQQVDLYAVLGNSQVP